MRGFLDVILSTLFPHRCAYCAKVVSNDTYVCVHCEKDLPRITDEICNKCGREKKKCTCKNAEKYFDGLTAPFYFKGNVRKGIHRFKFRHLVDSAEEFAREMSETVVKRYKGIRFDFITEVPLTEKSRRERGYNQCELLAEKLGKNLGVEYKKGALVKLFETKKQHLISPAFRKGNLCGVFDVTDPSSVEGKVILLCDDISTTGETFNECAKMLWLNGAKAVYCISVALTSKDKK